VASRGTIEVNRISAGSTVDAKTEINTGEIRGAELVKAEKEINIKKGTSDTKCIKAPRVKVSTLVSNNRIECSELEIKNAVFVGTNVFVFGGDFFKKRNEWIQMENDCLQKQSSINDVLKNKRQICLQETQAFLAPLSPEKKKLFISKIKKNGFSFTDDEFESFTVDRNKQLVMQTKTAFHTYQQKRSELKEIEEKIETIKTSLKKIDIDKEIKKIKFQITNSNIKQAGRIEFVFGENTYYYESPNNETRTSINNLTGSVDRNGNFSIDDNGVSGKVRPIQKNPEKKH